MVLKVGTPQEVDQKYMESFEMWFWRRRDISLIDHVKYDVLHICGSHPVVLITKESHSLHRVKEERDVIQ